MITIIRTFKQVRLKVRIIVIIGAVTPSWAMILRLSYSVKIIK